MTRPTDPVCRLTVIAQYLGKDIMEIIRSEQRERWNHIIKSFSDWDIYNLNEYVSSFRLHGDGEPILIYIADDEGRMAYCMMENDIAEVESFKTVIPRGRYYDWTTPYGYGGPLIDGTPAAEWVASAFEQIRAYAAERHIVSQFFRFHPLIQNQKLLEQVSRVLYMKKTVYVDTTSEEIIYANMTSNNRNMVRKAQKNGVHIIVDYGERIHDFIEIYEETMRHRAADEYYFFDRSYFDYIIQAMRENIILFYAEYEGRMISSAIFFYNDRYMHYHLSGTRFEYRKLGAANLLLSEAAYWAQKRGITKLHLGGGVGIEDSLLSFKKHFNKNGLIDFCIGCNIFIEEDFEALVELRRRSDPSFDANRPYMIRYRG